VKTKEAIKAASTCRGSISIIHEDNEVTVLNPNDPDKEEPRLLGRKRIKNITNRKTKQKKTTQKYKGKMEESPSAGQGQSRRDKTLMLRVPPRRKPAHSYFSVFLV
jgi:hypothetical protein